MTQCVAVCCSVLQCVAVCCSVLQCVAVYCSVLQYKVLLPNLTRRTCCSVIQCVVVCCSVLQCVAVCCSVLQYKVPNLTRRTSPNLRAARVMMSSVMPGGTLLITTCRNRALLRF